MRKLLLVLLIAASLAGCGVLDDEGPPVADKPDPAVFGPARAVPGERPEIDLPKLARPSAAVARALDRGGIGVVDITGTVGVEPGTLETASDAHLQDLKWTRWSARGAEGRGDLQLLDCQPSCATGNIDKIPARITLSGVKTCDGRRYFDRGEVAIDAASTPSGSQPATYLRAPC